MPSALSSVTGRWWCSNDSLNAYSGLVPMSPKTTPEGPERQDAHADAWRHRGRRRLCRRPASPPPSCPAAAAGDVSPHSSAWMSSGVGGGAVPPSAVVTSESRLIARDGTSHSIARKPPSPAGSVSASASRTRLRIVSVRTDGRRGRRGPLPPPCFDQLVDAVQRAGTAAGCARPAAGGSWSRQTSTVTSCSPDVGEVVAAALVAAERPQPLAPRPQRQLGGAARPRSRWPRPARRRSDAGRARAPTPRPRPGSGRVHHVVPSPAATAAAGRAARRAPRLSRPSSPTATNASRQPPSNTARRNGRLSSSSLATTTPVTPAGSSAARLDAVGMARRAAPPTPRR